MLDYLSSLNKNQYAAVTTDKQHVRVVAGAGSGKTKVLTSRLAFLIDSRNVDPRRILAITFTNKAAKEMKDRVERTLQVEGVPTIISTYHSFCARFLREEISKIGNYTRSFTVIDEEDQKKIIKDVKQDIDIHKQFKPEALIGFVGRAKTYTSIPDNLDENSELGIKWRVYLAYAKFLEDNNYLDFDDLILKTEEILSKFPMIRQKWQNRFDHILIDEFQDTNDLEYSLVKHLLKEDSCLYVVGDPDQTIYTWRGANLDIIMDFTKDFKDSVDYILDKNYRSTQSILNAANTLIKNNQQRLSKDLSSDKNIGDRPVIYGAYNIESEADWIANQIYKMKRNNDNLNYKDIAIFYRSNWYSKEIEEKLVNNRIPYRIYGSVKFYERKEIKDALCYLRLITDSNDILAFTRIINVPSRKIGAVTLSKIFEGAEAENISPYDYVKKNNEGKDNELGKFVDLIESYKVKVAPESKPNFNLVLKDLLEDSKYIFHLDKDDEEDRLDNLRTLGESLFQTQIKNPDITLKEILQDIALYSAQDEMKDDNVVSLMTVHTAKGLEFPIVFVAGLSESVFPSRRAVEASMENKKALEEERRLAYVAYTRAKEQLFLTFNTGYDFQTGNNRIESRFIYELGDTAIRESERIRNARQGFGNAFISKPEPKFTPKQDPKPKPTNVEDYRPGMIVVHKAFGEGVILEVTEKVLNIAFFNPAIGTKMISKTFAGLSKKGA